MNRKNVVVILADQFRKDCIGAYGNTCVNTPNMDRLAAQSIRFEHSYVANPICSPNRMTWFSGMFPSNHGVYTNGLVKQDDGRTIMHELRRQGYQTASIGKIHFNPYSEESAGKSFESVDRWEQVPEEDGYSGGYFGFDYLELTIGHTLPKAHYYRWFKEHGGTDDMFTVTPCGEVYSRDEICGIRNMPSGLSSSAFVGDRSVNYLRNLRDREKPFFLCASFPDPHHPFTSCYDDYERWKDREVKAPVGEPEDLDQRPAHFKQQFQGSWSRKGVNACKYENGIPKQVAKERTRHTYAMIEAIDRNVGLILDELERQNLMDDTIVILGADHGELLGDHGLWMKGPFLYEGLINTPLLMHIPGISPRVSEGLVSSVDITPTILDLLGFEIPAYVDGISQLPQIEDEGCDVRNACMVEYRNGYDCDVNVNAIVKKEGKFIMYETGEQEYTDLAGDPEEKINAAKQEAYDEAVAEAAKSLLLERLRSKSKGSVQYGHA
ncbi:hypothetical protein C0033_05425 [Clostridium sp. chh4-2]|uniref:sulfatase family protein n=1 Tax=Clostridium sp. chh4-2 TaxID=2067550 RepID=UPI000CCECCD6|nr:sulfatase-like hydrolase/transferase [Clostridium sp. chh4-2]PNV62975.1 hypothetical protein C0033_05425 [Clostridium sp. chh4-2]